jgi:signal peptidase I
LELYEAAGRKRWEAGIPVYNAIVLMKIIGRPTWWTLYFYSNYKSNYVSSNLVETLRSFGKNLDTFRHNYFWSVYLLYQLL